jgi:diacylglycerol kinase (ATP)
MWFRCSETARKLILALAPRVAYRIAEMRKAAMLFNPASGRRRERRLAVVEEVQAALKHAGVETSPTVTRSHEEAVQEVARAVASGFDTVVVCGGDGTVHAAIQSLAGTNVQLAIIPSGTANALAHDLCIPLDPRRAALAALNAQPLRVALGRITYLDFKRSRACRYFTVAAGVGVDAHLFYALSAGLKEKMGMAAYYLKAWHLWMSHRMQRFPAEFTVEGGSEARTDLTQLLAVRIRNFGGILRELAAGADLRRGDLRLVMCKTDNRLVYFSYVARALIGGKWEIPEVELAYSRSVTCESGPGRVYVEADGELLGTPPVEISVVPDALTILVP